MRLLAVSLCLTGIFLTSCGTPGAPQPPSLEIPKPVNDLKALRKGDTVTLSWTAPTQTTDGSLVKKQGKMMVSRSAAGPPQVVATLELEPALKHEKAPTVEATDSVGEVVKSGADFVNYSVVGEGSSGRRSAPSNQATAPLVPVMGPPAHVNAVPVPSGIAISWDQSWPPQNPTHLNAQYAYRIMRREQGAKNVVTVKQVNAGNAAMALVDTGIEWQKHYEYWITPVTQWQGAGKKGEVEGDDSPVVAVFANDIFPPAVPAGLQAVFSGLPAQLFIDLSWTPDTEPDLAGYNVYRHVGDAPPVKINSELLKTSAFRDTDVKPGTRYFYSVTALDQRGNESGKSAEASESVPP